MKSQEQNQCEKKMLYDSLGIEMPSNISSIFYWSFMKNQEKKLKSEENLVSQSWYWNLVENVVAQVSGAGQVWHPN